MVIKDEAVVQMNWIESLANKAALWINQERKGEHIDYLKMKLGIEMILINLSKSIFVYGVAIICHLFVEVLLIHSAYYAIRRVAFGLHANSSTQCTVISMVIVLAEAYLCQFIILNNYIILGLGILLAILIYRYAPADTDKFPLIGQKRRQKLRNKAVITCCVIVLLTYIIPNTLVKSLLLSGVFTQVVLILPITYKILKRSVNNYEKYEREIC